MAATVTAEREERRSSSSGARGARSGIAVSSWLSTDVLLATMLGSAALLVYGCTMYPSIAWGDSPELTAAACQAGIPHPTGYPLYMLLGHAFLQLFPVGSVAYRMNLLSALCAALAIALCYPVILRICRSRMAAAVATLMLAFSQTFWSQALLAEVYSLHMLLLTAVMGAVLVWEESEDRRWLWSAAVLYGLCFAHHLMSALIAPALLFFALTSRRRSQFVRELPRLLPLFLLPLALYLYLPLAAWRDPDMNWGDPRTWDNFLAHVTGRQYQVGMFQLTAAQHRELLEKYLGSASEGGFLWIQFTPRFLWLAPLGLFSLVRSRWRLLGFTLLIYLATVGYALNYHIYDIEVYYLPSHLIIAAWIACGLAQLGMWLGRLGGERAGRRGPRRLLAVGLGAALLAMPLSLLRANWSRNDHHDDRSALIYARAAVDALKPNAVLFSGNDNFQFPLMYTLFVEKRRPDVTMVSLQYLARPERLRLLTRLRRQGMVVRVKSPDPGQPWGDRQLSPLFARLIADNIERRPVYGILPSNYLKIPWLAEATAPYSRVTTSNIPATEFCRQTPPLAAANPRPQQPLAVSFGPPRPGGEVGNGLALLGYDLEPRQERGILWLRMSYYWRIKDPALARQAMVWVLFTDAAGQYFKMPDGSPEFHNVHPIAYGLGEQGAPLPGTLKETFDLYVPPRQWGQALRIRLAVAVAGQLLVTGADGGQWVELGEMSVSMADTPH